MSRTPCPPTVYVVAWDDLGIIKAGFTARRRWRDWELRGARLVVLQEYSTGHLALEVETEMHDALSERGLLAFGSEMESRVLLGRCGGWRETFRVDADPHAFPHAVAMLTRIAVAHAEPDAATHCGSAYACAYPETSSDLLVNRRSMRSGCGIDAESMRTHHAARVVNQQVTQPVMRPHMRPPMPRARDERTNSTYGRLWTSRDPSLTLINARVRVRPGDGQ